MLEAVAHWQGRSSTFDAKPPHYWAWLHLPLVDRSTPQSPLQAGAGRDLQKEHQKVIADFTKYLVCAALSYWGKGKLLAGVRVDVDYLLLSRNNSSCFRGPFAHYQRPHLRRL